MLPILSPRRHANAAPAPEWQVRKDMLQPLLPGGRLGFVCLVSWPRLLIIWAQLFAVSATRFAHPVSIGTPRGATFTFFSPVGSYGEHDLVGGGYGVLSCLAKPEAASGTHILSTQTLPLFVRSILLEVLNVALVFFEHDPVPRTG